MKITRVTQDLIDEFTEKIGSLSILSIELNDICKDADCEENIFDITLDDERIDTVVWNGFSLTLIRNQSAMCIESIRFYEVIIS